MVFLLVVNLRTIDPFDGCSSLSRQNYEYLDRHISREVYNLLHIVKSKSIDVGIAQSWLIWKTSTKDGKLYRTNAFDLVRSIRHKENIGATGWIIICALVSSWLVQVLVP